MFNRPFSIFKEATMFETVCPKKKWEKMKRSVENPVPFFGTNADKSCQTETDAQRNAMKIMKIKKVKKSEDFLSLMYPAKWAIFLRIIQ